MAEPGAGILAARPISGDTVDHLARRGLLPRFPTVAAWAVYRGLATFAMRSTTCFPSVARLAAACGHMSERAVQANLRKLIALRFVRIVRHGGMRGEDRTANVYELLKPPRDGCTRCTPRCTPCAGPVHAVHPNLEGKLELNDRESARASFPSSDGEDPAVATFASCVDRIVAAVPQGVPFRRAGIESILRPLADDPAALARIADEWIMDEENAIVPMDSPLASLQKRVRDATQPAQARRRART